MNQDGTPDVGHALVDQMRLFSRRITVLAAAGCTTCCGEQISPLQGQILFEIQRQATPSMHQVAAELGMDITTFSRQIKNLEARGLLTRQRSPADRRVSRLSLTRSGNELMERISRHMANGIARPLAALTPFEQDTVVRSLALLNQALNVARNHPHRPLE
ncbi:MarR family transcriptional regulator [Trichlorobacter ammonificans]|uniref:MarR family transcriptional regulator n=1 Tax=Trichlorobacter ammonificans TaxID=2916410 RepID=A0ABM9D553_9BACT|nr:MarR family transcriptional regulator [Trichlorobacter ammonificans]